MGARGISDGRPRPLVWRIRPVVLWIVGQIVLALGIAVTTGLLIMHLREHALSDAEREQDSLSIIIADHAERVFEAIELVQTAILERLRHDGIRTPAAFRAFMSSADVHEDLGGRDTLLPQLNTITIIDANGNLINTSRPLPVPLVRVTERDYFKMLSLHTEMNSLITEPVESHADGKWTMYLARNVVSPDGAFLGIILGGVELGYFEQLYSKVVTGPDNTILLYRQDGRLLVRYPPLYQSTGQSYAGAGLFRTLRASGGTRAVFRGKGPIDGLERLIVGRSLVKYPMVVTVSNTMSWILGEWRRQVIYLVASAIVLELVMAAVGLLMLRQFRDQRLLSDARAAMTQAEGSRLRAEAELAVARGQERADREINAQNVRFGAALSNMSQALCMFDKADRLVVSNRRWAEMFNLPATLTTRGVTMDAFLAWQEVLATLQASDVEQVLTSLRQLKAEGVPATRIRELADGRTLSVNFVPVEDDGWLLTMEDISEHCRAEAKMMHMAHHDALTGLPNRVLFHDKLGEAVARSQRGESCAVLCLDLDHFKSVNDTLGHPLGDALLQAVTLRLLAQTRKTDTVARLGGDEFAIVQFVSQPDDATSLAGRIIGSLSAPFELDGHQVTTATSIGIAVVPGDGDDPDQILRNADMALYRAKADGRGRFRFFEPAMDARLQARRTMEIDLRKAVAAGEFELYYQPLMNLRTGSVIGFEALMRWFHPHRGMVAPSDFIPLAEEIGLLVPLGAWALRQACRDAVTWPATMKVAVNVSVTQFASGTLVADVIAAVDGSGLDPRRLELEITETVVLEQTDATLVVLHRLRELGVGIAMDDFGTGYSSLSYLRRFPFTKVKIDRSFIEGLGRAGDCDAIVTAVTELCETLGMITLAEGVETEDQLRRLRAGKCVEAQGYLFSRPRPASDVAGLCQTLTTLELAEG